jgi:hypothetical protein
MTLIAVGDAKQKTRLGRWARRLGIGVGVLLVCVTAAAFGVDLATSGGEPAAALYAGPFVRIDGTLVAYRRWGTQGRPIVLLGGAAEPSWVWHALGPMLAAADHRVYALDLPPFRVYAAARSAHARGLARAPTRL